MKEIYMAYVLCATDNNPIEDLSDLNLRTMKSKIRRTTQSQTTDLTRFGQLAYVLGAIHGERFQLGRGLQ